MSENSDVDPAVASADVTKNPPKSKPAKVLPTDRITVETQLAVARAYVAASGDEKKATSNAEVAAIANLNPNTVSLCNPFFVSIGLLIRDGQKQRPTEPVFDYQTAYQWNAATAAQKLYQIFADSWAAKALLPKLAFRTLTRDEAITFLAEEAKASIDYKSQLSVLLEFLQVTGVIAVDGNTVSKFNDKREAQRKDEPPREDKLKGENKPSSDTSRDDVEVFSVPIPGKPSATITVPKGLDADDWEMLAAMMQTYITRWKKGLVKNGGEQS